MHVRRQHDVDAGDLFGQAHVVGQAHFRRHHHDIDLVHLAQLLDHGGDDRVHLGAVPHEVEALGDRTAHDLRAAVGGQAEDADLDVADVLDDVGRQHTLAGLGGVGTGRLLRGGGVEHVGGNGVPRRQGSVIGEEFQEALGAVNELPVARGEGVDLEGVEYVDDGLAAGVEHLGRALDGVAGMDQQGVGILLADVLDHRVDPCQAPFDAVALGVGAKVGPRNQVAVEVACVDQRHLSGARNRLGHTQTGEDQGKGKGKGSNYSHVFSLVDGVGQASEEHSLRVVQWQCVNVAEPGAARLQVQGLM